MAHNLSSCIKLTMHVRMCRVMPPEPNVTTQVQQVCCKYDFSVSASGSSTPTVYAVCSKETVLASFRLLNFSVAHKESLLGNSHSVHWGDHNH